MSMFRELRDECNRFEEDLQNDSPHLFCARIGQSYDEEITNKMQDLSLFTAKLRLLQAKSISMGPDCPQPISEEDSLAGYEDAAMWKVIEQQTVKTVGQFCHVQALITTPDSKLDPEMMERKEAIISKLKEYRLKLYQLREMDATLTKKDEEHSALRSRYDQELGELKELREQASSEDTRLEGPLYDKLKVLIDKMEMMRWLISRLAVARAGYDWLSDPDRRLNALKMAREPNTLESYTGM